MWTKESDWLKLFPGAVIESGAFIGSGAVIGSGARITRDVHTLQGPYVATLSEHGIKIGCEPIRTADEWEALDLTEIDGDASRYRSHLLAVCAYWRAEFGGRDGE